MISKCTVRAGYSFGSPLALSLQPLIRNTAYSFFDPEPGSHKRQAAVSIQLCNCKLQFLIHNLICTPYDITAIDCKTEYVWI